MKLVESVIVWLRELAESLLGAIVETVEDDLADHGFDGSALCVDRVVEDDAVVGGDAP